MPISPSDIDLAHRYLWGPAADMLLADEAVDCGADQTPGTADDVRWVLTDHQNSVRDLVEYDPATGDVGVVKHVTYDAFGNVLADTAPGVESLFLYTARPFDAEAGLQNNLHRWYDPATGRWVSEDPIGFAAGDANLYRYVGNGATWAVDPEGLDGVIYRLVDGYRVRFRYAQGRDRGDFFDRPGPYGQPGRRTDGDVTPSSSGLSTTSTVWGGYACNTERTCHCHSHHRGDCALGAVHA